MSGRWPHPHLSLAHSAEATHSRRDMEEDFFDILIEKDCFLLSDLYQVPVLVPGSDMVGETSKGTKLNFRVWTPNQAEP